MTPSAPEPSDPENTIRLALRAARKGGTVTLAQIEAATGLDTVWLVRFDHGGRSLRNAHTDRYKRLIALAFPELAEALTELSLAWLPDAARARLRLAWAPAASGDGE